MSAKPKPAIANPARGNSSQDAVQEFVYVPPKPAQEDPPLVGQLDLELMWKWVRVDEAVLRMDRAWLAATKTTSTPSG